MKAAFITVLSNFFLCLTETELNDPSPQFNFGGNSGTIGQQGENYGTAIGQQHNNRYGRRQFNFGGNSGTIGQQGENYGTAIGQQHNNRYGRRQFNFGGNSGTIGQQGQNMGTAIGQQHNNRYGRRQFNFGGNSGTIGQQGQNMGTAIGQQHNGRCYFLHKTILSRLILFYLILSCVLAHLRNMTIMDQSPIIVLVDTCTVKNPVNTINALSFKVKTSNVKPDSRISNRTLCIQQTVFKKNVIILTKLLIIIFY